MKKKNTLLTLSNIVLLLGFIPFAFFLIYGQIYMQEGNPDLIGFGPLKSLLCFFLAIGFWSLYILLELKRGNIKGKIVPIIFSILAIIGIISIAIQPSTVINDVVCRRVPLNGNIYYPDIKVNDVITVTSNISDVHRIFFIEYLVLILFFLYIMFFIFPKQFTSILPLKIFNICVFIFVLSVIIYGYATEYNTYVDFFNNLSLPLEEMVDPKKYTLHSYVINSNAYGMIMLLGILFAFINHTLTNKWYNYPIGLFFFINMIFSLCKASLILAIIILILWFYIYVIKELKIRLERSITGIVLFTFFLAIISGLTLGSYYSEGAIIPQLYKLLKGAEHSETIANRIFIWDNTYLLLNGTNFLLGRGFGIINYLLLPMNRVNGDNVFPTHNSFLSLLAEGGIIYLFAFLASVFYIGKTFFKTYKNNKIIALSIGIALLSFLIYSCIETIHYLYYLFIPILFIIYNIQNITNSSIKVPYKLKSKKDNKKYLYNF